MKKCKKTPVATHVLWSNSPEHFDFKKWKLIMFEENPYYIELTEEELYERMCDENNSFLDDEKYNLERRLDSDIIVIAKIRRWDGSHNGYRIIPGNLKECLAGTCGDYVTWSVEGDEFLCQDAHHDGTNVYRYRKLKKDLGELSLEMLEHAICCSAENMESLIDKCTEPLGSVVREIYGW